MGLGQLRGPSWETGTPLNCPNQEFIVAAGGLEVSDGGHWLVVMKNPRGLVAQSNKIPRLTRLWNPRSRKARDLGHPARCVLFAQLSMQNRKTFHDHPASRELESWINRISRSLLCPWEVLVAKVVSLFAVALSISTLSAASGPPSDPQALALARRNQ